MLDNSYDISYGQGLVTLKKISEQNNSSTFYGEDGNDKITVNVAHTIPKAGNSGESHLVRLDVDHYNVDGVHIRTSSAWTVIKTLTGTQDTAAVTAAQAALAGFLAPIVGQVIQRES